MQSAIEYAAITSINLTPLFLVTNPLTNSSHSDTLQVKSPFLVKQTDWCYILGSPNTTFGKQIKKQT